jgi:hypothetical protein
VVTIAADPAVVPSCFGFVIDSTVPLLFTRGGGGVERLRIAEHRVPWPGGDGSPLFEIVDGGRRVAGLWSRGEEYQFLVDDLGWYRITPGARSIEIPAGVDPIRREQVLWGVPATLCFLARGDLSIHAAAVEVDEGAVLLAAPGNHGKTTLAVAFHRAGYRILTEDSSCCSVDSGATLRPGPGLVRLRDGSGDPPDGLELARTRAGRAELAIAARRRGGGAPIPLRGVVFLRPGEGRPTLTRCTPPEALKDLWALHFGLGGNSERATSFGQVADLAHGVPCWNLSRPFELGRLGETVDLIVEAVR